MAVNFDFTGDANRLISEMRKIQKEVQRESQERRKAEQSQRQMDRDAKQRLREQITQGRASKRVVEELGKAARDAMQKAKDPAEEYTRAIKLQEDALAAGAISLDQFKQRKFQLLRVLRDAKREQTGENEQLRLAAQLVKQAETSTQKYDQQMKALKTSLDRGKISQEQYAAAAKKLQTDQDAANKELQEALKLAAGNESAFQRFNGQVANLSQQLRAGKISQDQYAQGLRNANAELDRNSSELQEAARLVNATQAASQRYDQQLRSLRVALQSGRISQKQYATGLKQAKTEFDAAEKSGGKFRKVLEVGAAVTGFTGGIGLAVRAVAQLRAEYDRLIERQKLAVDAQATLAEAQEQATFNLGEDPTLNVQQLFGKIRGESQRLGMREVDLTKAVSDALSARGDESAATAVDSVIAAAELRRFAPEELPQLAAAGLDISKGTGKSIRESLGFLLEIGTLSRVTNLQSLAEHVAPGVVGGVQLGVTPEFGGAVNAALTQGIVDPSGRTSRTALTKLLDQLRGFEKFKTSEAAGDVSAAEKTLEKLVARQDKLTEKEQTAKKSQLPKLQQEQQELDAEIADARRAVSAAKKTEQQVAAQPKGVRAQFEQIVADKSQLELFFRSPADGGFGASFEAKALPTVEGLLQQGTKANDQFVAALKTLQTADNQKRFDATVEKVESLPSVQIAKTAQAMENLAEQVTLADEGDAISGAVREGLKNLRLQLGNSSLGTSLQQLQEDFASGGDRTLPELIGRLERIGEQLVRTEVTEVLSDGLTGGTVVTRNREVTELDRKQAAAVDQVVKLLQEIQQKRQPAAEQAPKPEAAAKPAELPKAGAAVDRTIENRKPAAVGEAVSLLPRPAGVANGPAAAVPSAQPVVVTVDQSEVVAAIEAGNDQRQRVIDGSQETRQRMRSDRLRQDTQRQAIGRFNNRGVPA